MKRREFLRKTTSAAFGAVAAPYVIPSGVLATQERAGANDRIQVGIIGLGGRAQWIVQNEGMPGAEVVAVADAYKARCENVTKWVPEAEKWHQYHDYREMFDKEKLDAVFVETTSHARVRICMHALQAGLDVYGEKPLTLTVAEGRALVRAVRHYGRILQTGTQQRAIPINLWASQRIREGLLGKVQTVIACNFEGPRRWSPQPAQPIPDGLDWDQWCNQAELRPYHRDLQYGWSNYWAYDGGGQSWGVTGWGTHALDQVQCALGTDDTGPVEIWPEEEGPKAKVTMRYANGTLLKMHGPRRDHADLGAIFVGERGKLEIKRGSCLAEPAELLDGAPPDTPEGPHESLPHIQNFFDCMRSRERPLADVETGHRATTVCHLVNICRELGRKLEWDPVAERFVGDEEADRMLSRPRRAGYELPEIG